MSAFLRQHETSRTDDVPAFSEAIVVLAPSANDATLAVGILREHGLAAVVTSSLETMAAAIDEGAAVALIASEVLDQTAAAAKLRAALDRQEAWSDIPVLLFNGEVEEAADRATELLGPRAQIVLLERPLGVAAFVTATKAALRSRHRQYQVKTLLDAQAASAVALTRAHEELNRAKDEFLATLGHELRSPMTAIRGWVQMLQLGQLSPEEATAALAMIESSTRVQAHIIEDLMDITRIIAGKVMIEPQMVELGPLVETVVGTFRPAAALQGVHLRAELPNEPVVTWADPVRLQQVGWNLVSNAIKFTPRGGLVRVILSVDGVEAVIQVRDTGAGIAPQLLPHVFERYRQDDDGPVKAHAGLGLGLAIVRHLVESHGGTIVALSEGRGKGAEFVVRLPLRSEPARTSTDVPESFPSLVQ